MSGPSFTEKVLRVTVKMATGEAGSGSFGETIELTGFRMVANVTKWAMPSGGMADIRIYGMAESLMNQCSTLGAVLNNVMGRNNVVTIFAGDTSVAGTSVIFIGTVRCAFQNLDDMPDTSFTFSLIAGGYETLKPIPPTSYRSSVDIATIIGGLAEAIGKRFDNNGVSVIVPNAYFTGTGMEQIHEALRWANIEGDLDKDTISIWPRGGSKKSSQVPLISPRTGLIGYPRYSDAGIQFRTLFNPNIAVGGNVTIQSGLARASGTWNITGMTYNLACQVPSGPWFCDCSAMPLQGAGPTGTPP